MEALAHTLEELEIVTLPADVEEIGARVEEINRSITPAGEYTFTRCNCPESDNDPESGGCVWNDADALDAFLGRIPDDWADPDGVDWDAIDRAYDAHRDACNGVD